MQEREENPPRSDPSVHTRQHRPYFTVAEYEAMLEREENPPQSDPSVHTRLSYAVNSEEFERRQREYYEGKGMRYPAVVSNQPPRVLPSDSKDVAQPS